MSRFSRKTPHLEHFAAVSIAIVPPAGGMVTPEEQVVADLKEQCAKCINLRAGLLGEKREGEKKLINSAMDHPDSDLPWCY